jgi:hypothetical protein
MSMQMMLAPTTHASEESVLHDARQDDRGYSRPHTYAAHYSHNPASCIIVYFGIHDRCITQSDFERLPQKRLSLSGSAGRMGEARG